MSYRKISQAEARAALKRAREAEEKLEAAFDRWTQDYPSGVHLLNIPHQTEFTHGSLFTIARLGYAIIGKLSPDEKTLRVFAVKP